MQPPAASPASSTPTLPTLPDPSELFETAFPLALPVDDTRQRLLIEYLQSVPALAPARPESRQA